jgi:hypothetical protein
MHKGFTANNVEITGTGHPDWSLTHVRLGDGNISVDPGYGISSSRYRPQYQSLITNCRIVDAARKAVDAHTGGGDIIRNNYFKSGYFGIQVAIEETNTDFTLDEYRSYTLPFDVSNNEFRTGFYAIDFVNGSFGRGPRERATQMWLRVAATIKDNKVFAPFGWRYNYGHSGFDVSGNTFTFELPYGLPSWGSVSPTAITHGALGVSTTERGPVMGDVICNNLIQNGPDGNYVFGIYTNRVVSGNISGNRINITPYADGTLGDPYESVAPFRDGLATTPVGRATGYYLENSIVENNLVWNDATPARGHYSVYGALADSRIVSRAFKTSSVIIPTSGAQATTIANLWVKRELRTLFPGIAQPGYVDVDLSYTVSGASGEVIDEAWRVWIRPDGSSITVTSLRSPWSSNSRACVSARYSISY